MSANLSVSDSVYIVGCKRMNHKRQKLRWAVIGAVVAIAIIGPFIVFGEQIEAWTETFLESARMRPWTSAMVLGGLLGSDILFPVPSSIVSTACGVVHGFMGGALISMLGMTFSCLAGYAIAKWMGRPLVSRFVGDRELDRLHGMEEKYGDWIIVVARPVPVLAEASVLFLGLSAMSFARFAVLSTLSNLAISIVYAAAGAWAAGIHSFFPALAASILLPWVLMRLSPKRGTEDETDN